MATHPIIARCFRIVNAERPEAAIPNVDLVEATGRCLGSPAIDRRATPPDAQRAGNALGKFGWKEWLDWKLKG